MTREEAIKFWLLAQRGNNDWGYEELADFAAENTAELERLQAKFAAIKEAAA